MKQFIGKAIKHPGALTRSATAAGESPMAFAREHQHSGGVTGQRARLALVLNRVRPKGHAQGDVRRFLGKPHRAGGY